MANNTVAVSTDNSNKNVIDVNTPKATSVNNNKNNRVTRHNDWSAEISAINTRNVVTWHRRLGHINFRKLGEAHKTVNGIGKVTAPNMVCKVCAEAKATRKLCKQTRTRAEKPRFRTHADLIGPIIPATYLQGGKYILTLVDDYSRYAMTYILKNKKETADRLEAYFKYIRTLFLELGRLAALHTDAGTEFTNARVKKILKELGIRLELAETDIHEHNGTAVRFNRTHQNKIRVLLFDAGFSNTFWGWASDAATYLYNRVPHTVNGDVTPYERFYDKRPNVRNIRVFGTLAHTLQPRTKRLDRRMGKRYIVGFTDTGYIVYNPVNGKTERSCNIRTDETWNYGDDLKNRKGRTMVEIDFLAGDVSGDNTGNCTAENNGNSVINDGNQQVGDGLRHGGDKMTGDGKDLAGNEVGLETVNESITLDSSISLGNSGLSMAESAQEVKSENGQKVTAARNGGISAERHKVTVRNEDSDSDSEAGDDDKESVYSIDLGSNITLGDETTKSAEFMEWDASKFAGENIFEPAATSMQYVNAITKNGGENGKIKVDN